MNNKWELSTDKFNYYAKKALSAKNKQEFLAELEADEIEQATNIYEAVHIPIKKMIKKAGYTQARFAKEYIIPIRTVEDWCASKSTPTTYLKLLLAEKLGVLKTIRAHSQK